MTDKITFNVGGERHDLPIDSSKTLRVGSVSPDMKLTVTGSFNPALKIVFGSGKEPAMTIHPDGKITLGENVEPTEAAAACIEAMSHMIQRMVKAAHDRGYYDGRQYDGAEERAKIVAWLMREEEGYPSSKYSGFAAMIREEIEAGEHLK